MLVQPLGYKTSQQCFCCYVQVEYYQRDLRETPIPFVTKSSAYYKSDSGKSIMLAQHFGMLITEVKYADIIKDFEVIEFKYII